VRIYTVALSVVVHLLTLVVLVVVPLIATDVLPDPRRALEFVQVTPIVLPPSLPRRDHGPHQSRAGNRRSPRRSKHRTA
jgi:hypothetical protein